MAHQVEWYAAATLASQQVGRCCLLGRGGMRGQGDWRSANTPAGEPDWFHQCICTVPNLPSPFYLCWFPHTDTHPNLPWVFFQPSGADLGRCRGNAGWKRESGSSPAWAEVVTLVQLLCWMPPFATGIHSSMNSRNEISTIGRIKPWYIFWFSLSVMD